MLVTSVKWNEKKLHHLNNVLETQLLLQKFYYDISAN